MFVILLTDMSLRARAVKVELAAKQPRRTVNEATRLLRRSMPFTALARNDMVVRKYHYPFRIQQILSRVMALFYRF